MADDIWSSGAGAPLKSVAGVRGSGISAIPPDMYPSLTIGDLQALASEGDILAQAFLDKKEPQSAGGNVFTGVLDATSQPPQGVGPSAGFRRDMPGAVQPPPVRGPQTATMDELNNGNWQRTEGGAAQPTPGTFDIGAMLSNLFDGKVDMPPPRQIPNYQKQIFSQPSAYPGGPNPTQNPHPPLPPLPDGIMQDAQGSGPVPDPFTPTRKPPVPGAGGPPMGSAAWHASQGAPKAAGGPPVGSAAWHAAQGGGAPAAQPSMRTWQDNVKDFFDNLGVNAKDLGSFGSGMYKASVGGRILRPGDSVNETTFGGITASGLHQMEGDRNNRAAAALEGAKVSETARHNRATEMNDAANRELDSKVKAVELELKSMNARISNSRNDIERGKLVQSSVRRLTDWVDDTMKSVTKADMTMLEPGKAAELRTELESQANAMAKAQGLPTPYPGAGVGPLGNDLQARLNSMLQNNTGNAADPMGLGGS